MIAICSFLFDIRTLCGFARHTVSHVDEYGNLSSPVKRQLHVIYVAWHVVAWEKKTFSRFLQAPEQIFMLE